MASDGLDSNRESDAGTGVAGRERADSSREATLEGVFFSDMLGFQEFRVREFAARWFGAPVGLATHGVVLAAIALIALYTPSAPDGPTPARLMLAMAPPPPPPMRRGTELNVDADRTASPEVTQAIRTRPLLAAVTPIPAEVLAPSFELQLGNEMGFDDGVPFGMLSGIPGGVTGGVPGGLVGGTVGGTGDQLPKLPKPDVGPRPIRMPQPRYTRAAIRDNVRGEVVLRVIIDERGNVKVLKVLRSVPGLDDEAVRVVTNQWRFHPATKNGRPVPALSDLRVQFNLY